jgi:hypothetical protein
MEGKAVADIKTTKNDASVESFLQSVEDPKQREDAHSVMALLEEITEEKPTMWGTSIVGFGNYHYKGKSGREGDWFLTGFSPRKANLTLYIVGGFAQHADLLQQLGKHNLGKGCLYIKRLTDVNMKTLDTIIRTSLESATKEQKQQDND